MKPTFALDLSREAIALLHRTPKGWLSIGDVAFDAPDLDEALDYLRKTALGLSPMGVATKIILPNSQILYTEVEAPGPSRNDKRRQIAAALEGRTPYAVEDLVFDWSGKGTTVKVAVVARDTLEEAETFALTHRLNPVSFVAIPEDGTFVGEPWFGPTTASETILAPGEAVDRDREAVTILHRDLPVSTPVAPVEPPAAAAVEDEDEEPLPGLEEALNADLPDAPASGSAAAPDLSLSGAAAEAGALAEVPVAAAAPPTGLVDTGAEVRSDRPEPDPPALDTALVSEATPEPALAADAAAGKDRQPVAAAPATQAETAAEVEEAPFAHVTDTAAFPDSDDIPPMPPGLRPSRAEEEEADDLVPAPSPAAMVAFASRRASASSPASAPVGGATRSNSGAGPSPATSPAPGMRLGQPIPRPAGAKAFPGLVTAPSIPGTRAKSKGKAGGLDIAAASTTGPTTIKSPARPGGTFGTAAPPKSRSGVVFMVLVALLLLFLAAIAAWSSFYLSRNVEAEVDTSVAADQGVPAVDDEMLADLQDPEGLDEPLPEAGADVTVPGDAGTLATESLPVNIGGDPALGETAEAAAPDLAPGPPVEDAAAGPAPDAVAEADTEAVPEAAAEPETVAEVALGTPVETAVETAAADPVADPVAEDIALADPAPQPAAEPAPEPAPDTTVATDVTAAQPPVEDQDEIFLSAMDAPPPTLDALALPAPASTPDTAPELPMPPPAFGTVYQFGPDGLLKATPEGILSPEGVMLIAGKPPLVPPSRSEAATAAALAAAPVTPEPAPETAPETAAETLPPEEAPVAGASPADASLVTAGEAPAAEPVPSDPAMAGFRPRPRPEDLAPATDDDAALATDAATDFAGLRPLPRPASVLAAASASRPADAPADLGAQGASLTAQAEAELAAAAALEAQNPSIVAISMRPQGRPRDLTRAVEAAVAAAVREPEPEPQPEADVVAAAAAPAPDVKPEELDEADEPETASAAPKIPTKASVAKQATFKNAINLSKINLIGTYGTDSRRTALIRQSNGRYKKVKVGDKIDGGTIKAITETEVRYQKGGKLISLKMPKA
jgi:hypothetical protein